MQQGSARAGASPPPQNAGVLALFWLLWGPQSGPRSEGGARCACGVFVGVSGPATWLVMGRHGGDARPPKRSWCALPERCMHSRKCLPCEPTLGPPVTACSTVQLKQILITRCIKTRTHPHPPAHPPAHPPTNALPSGPRCPLPPQIAHPFSASSQNLAGFLGAAGALASATNGSAAAAPAPDSSPAPPTGAGAGALLRMDSDATLKRRGLQAHSFKKTSIDALLHPRSGGATPYRIVLGEVRPPGGGTGWGCVVRMWWWWVLGWGGGGLCVGGWGWGGGWVGGGFCG